LIAGLHALVAAIHPTLFGTMAHLRSISTLSS
jgi:hypothetical protein